MTRRRKAAIIILVALVAVVVLAVDHKITNQCLAGGSDQTICYGVKG